MSILNVLEKKLGRYVPSNITHVILGGQILAYVLIYFNPQYANFFVLQGALLLEGEWWRILTFLLAPISDGLLFTAFAWIAFYILGISLEQKWGSFRYLLYILIAYIGTIFLSFLFPKMVLASGYVYASLFLAFAYLYPNYLFYIFFIIPVRVKWLALITWIGLFSGIVLGSLETRVSIGVSIANFLLFFGRDLLISIQMRTQHVSKKTGSIIEARKHYMKCEQCGATERDGKIFYYCEICIGDKYYCEDHIQGHSHKK